MLTKALSKIPYKYHEGLVGKLLIAAFVASMLGFASYFSFTEKYETITKETGKLFWKKITEEKIYFTFSQRLPYLILAIILIPLAVLFLISAFKLGQMPGRYQKYSAIIKGNEKLRIQHIAEITNKHPRKVINDIQNLINSGYIDDYYIDHKQGLLIDKSSLAYSNLKKIIKCPKCGANNEIILGVTSYCIYCDSLLID